MTTVCWQTLIPNIENFEDINFRKHFVRIRVECLTKKRLPLIPDIKRRYDPQAMQYIIFYITRINLLNLSFFKLFDLRETLHICFFILLFFKWIGRILHREILTCFLFLQEIFLLTIIKLNKILNIHYFHCLSAYFDAPQTYKIVDKDSM